MSQFQTVRPTYGLIGAVFNDDIDPGDGLFAALAKGLDRGDGWVVLDSESLTWFPQRLAVVLGLHRELIEDEKQQYAQATIEIVERVGEVSVELLKALNQLNSQAAGWVVWLDDEAQIIKCSLRIPLIRSQWWWVIVLWHSLRAACTMSEANADWLADISGGRVATRSHPTRGARKVRDSWIDSTLLGPREPESSLGIAITSLDIQQFCAVAESRELVNDVRVGWPMSFRLLDANGATFSQLREHWHSEFGLGWQFSSVDSGRKHEELFEHGTSLHELRIAATLNYEMMKGTQSLPILGGWIAVSPFDVVRSWFLPLPTIGEIQMLSQSTFGTAAGLMFVMFEESYARSESLKLSVAIHEHNDQFEYSMHTLNIKNGFGEFSSLEVPRSLSNELHDGAQLDIPWTLPRHILVCTLGIFNPAGPSIQSIELAVRGEKWVAFLVVRHPFHPMIVELGSCALNDFSAYMPSLVENIIVTPDDSPIESDCDFVDIRMPEFQEPIVRGLRTYAKTRESAYLKAECQKILNGRSNPWSMIETQPADCPELETEDVVELWIALVTDPNLVCGMQGFMRSAWEGAKLFADGDVELAQSQSNARMMIARERFFDDSQYREGHGAFIQHPFAT